MKRISNYYAPCMPHHSLVKENEVCYSIEVKEIVTGQPGFEEIIRDGNIIYVDKTEYVYRMVSSKNNFFFISRPRRFGKSLMCATLDALFSGKKELFDNLFISKTDYDFEKYPVLRFDFSQMKVSDFDVFKKIFQAMLREAGENCGLQIDVDDPSIMLRNILKNVEDSVIIIDEFDSSIIDAVSTGKLELAKEMRSTFNAFYSVIKANTPKIRFFFITGCTKLSGLNIFSAMNNLKDISRDAEYAAMFGYTEEELEHYFNEHIGYKLGLAKDDYSSREEFLDALRNYYDGYRFSPDSDVKVYNPVSIGYYFSSSVSEFRNYWMQTGGMSTLAVTLARTADLLRIADTDISVAIDDISCFDIIQIADRKITPKSATILLLYAGYLTIADNPDPYTVTLYFPNGEVRTTFLTQLLKTYTPDDTGPMSLVYRMYIAVKKGDVRGIIDSINGYYRLFNYTDFEKYKEQLVKILFKAYLVTYGMSVKTETPAGKGIIDATILSEKNNYIFEFKFDGKSSSDAFAQIIDRNYSWFFEDEAKPLHLIGIDFRSEAQQIVSYTHQIYGSTDVETVSLGK